jgi:hypothetical protein
VWPYPDAADVELHVDGSELVLPVRAAGAPSSPVHFEPSEQAPPLAVVHHGTDGPEREVRYNPETGEWQLSVDPNYGGSRTYPDGLEFNERVRETYSIRSGDPSSASCGSDWAIQLRRPGWDVRIAVSARMAVDDGDFVTTHQLTTTLNDEPVCQRAWNRRIPRPGRLPA